MIASTLENSPGTSGSAARYRFVVRSAEEAVTVIREKLGETARVVSVRQVEGEGLARFLSSPKLEVTAELPATTAPRTTISPIAEEPEPFTGYGAAELEETEMAATKVPESPGVPALSHTVEQAYGRLAPMMQEPEPAPAPVRRSSTSAKRRADSADPERLWTILDRAGIARNMVAQLKDQPGWQELSALPLAAALPRAGLLLRDTLAKTPVRPLTGRVGFFGMAGSGATTALCKQLIREVFFRQKSVCVMKVEGSRSNPSEGLAAFCEALSVPLLRTKDELAEVPQGVKVYFDLPSLSLGYEGSPELKGALEEFSITSRVMVINAAYDVDLIKAMITQADSLKSRHVVFSHLDELLRWGKLWEFVADSRRTTLFASTGQNLAGDCVRDVVELLTQKTLQTLNG